VLAGLFYNAEMSTLDGSNTQPIEYRVRHASRAVLVSPENRLLMLCCIDPTREGAKPFWITPGGGLQEGETHEQALRRELAEEVGMDDAAIGPWIWHRMHRFEWMGQGIEQHERFYWVQAHDESVCHLRREPDELMALTDHRWLTADGLRGLTDAIAPSRLAMFFSSLLEQGPPSESVDVGR